MIHRPALSRKTLVMATLAGALMAGVAPWPALGQARQVPETREQVTLSFAPLVKQTQAAVVNVYGARLRQARRSTSSAASTSRSGRSSDSTSTASRAGIDS